MKQHNSNNEEKILVQWGKLPLNRNWISQKIAEIKSFKKATTSLSHSSRESRNRELYQKQNLNLILTLALEIRYKMRITNIFKTHSFQGYLLELEVAVAKKLVVLEVENILLDTQRKEAALEKKL